MNALASDFCLAWTAALVVGRDPPIAITPTDIPITRPYTVAVWAQFIYNEMLCEQAFHCEPVDSANTVVLPSACERLCEE